MAELDDILVSGYIPAIRLRDVDAEATSYWDILASDFYNQGGYGIHNHTLGIHFNVDGTLATHPKWGENWEPRFADAGVVGTGLLEKNWDYTSIDRATAYRPFTFNVDLSTHAASYNFNCTTFVVGTQAGGTGTNSTITLSPVTQVASFPGFVTIGGFATTASQRLRVAGTINGQGALAAFVATGAVANDSLFATGANAVTGEFYLFNHASSATSLLGNLLQNSGAGSVREMLWAGSGGDAWIRLLANQDWSIGVDRSDSGKFKVSNGDQVGTSDRLTLDTDGNVSFAGHIKPDTDTVAQLPSAATAGAGAIKYCSNGNVGSACLVVSDGTNWKVVALGVTAVSA